jgi:CAAX prenyl protease-like protein
MAIPAVHGVYSGRAAGATEIEYCAPAVVFGLLTAAEGYLPLAYYPAVYAFKVLAVAVALYVCRRILGDIVPSQRLVLPSMLVGAVVFVIWIGGELWLEYSHLGTRTAYNPFTELSPAGAWSFIAVRLCGLVLLVPVFEELLWRSFLIRYATTANFQSIAPWAYSATAFWIVTGAAAVSHSEWLVALVANALYILWMRRNQSLFAVVVAHATTNLLLGAFILLTGYWQFW